MRDDAEHVVHVGVPILLFEDHAEHLFRFLELPLRVVLAAENEELLHALVHRVPLCAFRTIPSFWLWKRGDPRCSGPPEPATPASSLPTPRTRGRVASVPS